MQAASPTPLAAKLGVREGQRLALVHAPSRWDVPDLPHGVRVMRRRCSHADVVIAFFRRRRDLYTEVAALGEAVRPAGGLWLAWPRKAAGHESDLSDEVVRGAALPLGLVDVKVAALDQDWSGLRFVWRLAQREECPDPTTQRSALR